MARLAASPTSPSTSCWWTWRSRCIRAHPIPATLRAALPYQAFVNLVLLSAAPLVAVVMGRSALLVLLFLLPMSAIHANAAMSVQREHQAHHDELTGLPNRTLLLRQTNEALPGWPGRAAEPGSCCSTSTGSRRSTTRSGTRSAMPCCGSSRTG